MENKRRKGKISKKKEEKKIRGKKTGNMRKKAREKFKGKKRCIRRKKREIIVQYKGKEDRQILTVRTIGKKVTKNF